MAADKSTVPSSHGPVPVDLGPSFSSPWAHPNLYALLARLEVPTFAASIDFGASFGPDDSWATLQGLFAL